jgi:hypothetical protein
MASAASRSNPIAAATSAMTGVFETFSQRVKKASISAGLASGAYRKPRHGRSFDARGTYSTGAAKKEQSPREVAFPFSGVVNNSQTSSKRQA